MLGITLKGFIKLKIIAVVGFLDAQSKVQNKSGVDADASQLKCTMATGIVMDSQTSKLRSSAKIAPGEDAKTIKAKARRSD